MLFQVLLFYPDGKRSSSSEPQLGPGDAAAMHHAAAAVVAPAGMIGGQAAPAAAALPPIPHAAAAAGGPAGVGLAGGAANAAGDADAPGIVAGAAGAAVGAVVQHHGHPAGHPAAAAAMQLARLAPPGRRDTTNEYAALFVALIGEGPNPQGVVNTNEGKVVRAFHRFTLVDQTGQGRDLTKGRTREAGAVKISCARQDPNARNCHGYRKFVKVSSCLGMHPEHACCTSQLLFVCSNVAFQATFIHRCCLQLAMWAWWVWLCSCGGGLVEASCSSSVLHVAAAAAPEVWPGAWRLPDSGMCALVMYRVWV